MSCIREEIGRFLVDVLGVPRQEEGFPPEAQLVDDLGIDSAGLFELILWIEDHFKLRIPQQDMVLDNFRTLARIEEYLSGVMQSPDENIAPGPKA